MARAPENHSDSEQLSEWEARRKRIHKEALREVLIEFGLDPREPLEIQQDFAWVRRRRELEESNFVKLVSLVIGALVTGGIGALVYATQRYLNG